MQSREGQFDSLVTRS
nr:unnamed protein product [Callosobruchus chinensis]